LDVAATERAEAELNRLVERQAQRSGADGANALQLMWAASERKHREKQREENRTAWHGYYSHLAHSCRTRAAEYEAKAEQLLEEGTV